MKKGNFVAKYDWQVNKARTFVDRKKELKKGYRKHRGKLDPGGFKEPGRFEEPGRFKKDLKGLDF